LHGVWLPQYTVALDNRQMADKQGFFILTPLQLAGGGAVVLVQRGWLPRNFLQRDALLPFETPQGEVDVAGAIALAPARLYEFEKAQTGAIRQNLDIANYRHETGLPLQNFMLIQQGPAGDGLLRDWPLPNLGGAALWLRFPMVQFGCADRWPVPLVSMVKPALACKGSTSR
jgi:surfeit locus 1 family protein